MSWETVKSSITYYTDRDDWEIDTSHPISQVDPAMRTEIENRLFTLYDGSPLARIILEDLSAHGMLNFARSDGAGSFHDSVIGPKYVQLNFSEIDDSSYFNNSGEVIPEIRHLYLMHELTHAAWTLHPTPSGYSTVEDPPLHPNEAEINALLDLRGLAVNTTNQVAIELGQDDHIRVSYYGTFHPNGDNRALYFDQYSSYSLGEDIDNLRLGVSNSNGIPLPGTNVYAEYNDNIDTNILGNSKDLIFGLGDGDTIHSGYGRDFIYGGDGGDVLYGEGGDDFIEGGDGNDYIVGGSGSDTLNGGEGIDRADYSSSLNFIKLIYNSAGYIDTAPMITVKDGMGGTDGLQSVEEIIGTTKTDILQIIDHIAPASSSAPTMTFNAAHGQNGVQDIINTLGLAVGTGFEFINAKITSPNDNGVTSSGTLTDKTTGGVINLLNFDTDIIGTGSDDTIIDLTDGPKKIDGGAGDDEISTAEALGSVTLRGDEGSDKLTGGFGNDVIIGGWDSEFSAANELNGGAGNDRIISKSNLDIIDGGDGDDYILVQGGYASGNNAGFATGAIKGGQGNDYIDLRGDWPSINLTFGLGDGHDEVLVDGNISSSSQSYNITIPGLSENDFKILLFTPNVTELTPLDMIDSVSIRINSTQDWITLNNIHLYDVWADESQVYLHDNFASNFVINGIDPSLYQYEVESNFFSYSLSLSDFEESVAPSEQDTVGTEEDDHLAGGYGDDDLSGDDGDDVFEASGGSDTVDGGAGDDTLRLFGARSNFTVSGSGASATLFDHTGREGEIVITNVENVFFVTDGETYTMSDFFGFYGTTGADVITANDLNNDIYGLAANDELNGLGGDDNIEGGAGDDVINGGDGNDQLVGGDGDDAIDGGAGDFDTAVYSGSAADYTVTRIGNGITRVVTIASALNDGTDDLRRVERVFFVGDSSDLDVTALPLNGTAGDDTIVGIDSNDAIYGMGGNDVIDGAGGDDTIEGNEGDDVISGGDGDDALFGGDGADSLDGGDGYDYLWGGDGDDILKPGSGSSTVNGGAGSDVAVFSGSANDYSVYYEQDGTLYTIKYGTNSLTSVEYLSFPDDEVIIPVSSVPQLGTAGNDQIVGSSRREVLYGFAGDDDLYGGAGDDRLLGGTGADTMAGGAGDDYFEVDDQDDVVIEGANEGRDAVFATMSYTLGDNVEVLYLDGENGTGNALNNEIYGSVDDNILLGLAGNDLFEGAEGDDLLDGGDGFDLVTYWYSQSSYTIVRSVDGTVTVTALDEEGTDTLVNIEQLGFWDENDDTALVYVNVADLPLQGTEQADTLVGSEGNDTLIGGGGADIMFGGDGDDTYDVDDSDDEIYEQADEGYDTVYSSDTYVLRSNVEKLILVGSANLGIGNGMGNILIGNDSGNTLYGLDGDDRIAAGDGDDLLFGGNGSDVFVFNTTLGSGNVDTIDDFDVGADQIELAADAFEDLSLGGLASGKFVIGSAAADADDRIIYNDSTGSLYFDPDGNGSNAAVEFAVLGVGLSLTAANFVVL